MKSQELPKTDSIEELARFWDSHDLTAFEGHMEEVTEALFEHKRERVMVLRLEPEEVKAVQQVAKARGVEQSELLREWVLEKLGSVRI
ncbi:MAG TPA: CopG family antitoxin [Thermoanaerobaculia bacterium]|jgi:predicted DNA binding CopG/RHH family protein|nr:CopG family antitoxin [Thermoanaerobaculia bacterium]